ncbi:MAG TPA: metallophosphoesterase family protein [Chloroflexia bacterium]|nr:metallophosphoesterase family protein [Chloroflexia bacterium]
MIIGVVSDTHGTLHPRLLPVLREAGVELILHAGDAGAYEVIGKLSGVAPVLAVRGNVDVSGRTADLPEDLRVTWEGVDVYMTHIGGKPRIWLPRLPNPKPGVAICGHSHIALLEEVEGVLFLNPGSAGTQPRFGGMLSAALLTLAGGKASAEIINL